MEGYSEDEAAWGDANLHASTIRLFEEGSLIGTVAGTSTALVSATCVEIEPIDVDSDDGGNDDASDDDHNHDDDASDVEESDDSEVDDGEYVVAKTRGACGEPRSKRRRSTASAANPAQRLCSTSAPRSAPRLLWCLWPRPTVVFGLLREQRRRAAADADVADQAGSSASRGDEVEAIDLTGLCDLDARDKEMEMQTVPRRSSHCERSHGLSPVPQQ